MLYAFWAMTPASRAANRNFDNSCGDNFWHSCCGPVDGTKSNNWDVPESPAPLCPILPNAADNVFVSIDCAIQAAMTGTVGNLTQMTGNFSINGKLEIADQATFDGPVIWNSGEIARGNDASGQQATLNGGLTMQGADPKTLSFFGGFRLINAGAATWSGAGDWTIGMIPGACCPAIFENAAGATFTVSNTASIFQTAFGIGVFENAGILIKSSGGLSEWAVNLINTGLVHVQNGELRLTRAGVIGGTWQIDPGAELGIAGNFFELDPAVVIQGRAVVKQSGTNPGIKIDNDVTIDDLTVAIDGNLGGTGILRVAGSLTNEGGDPAVHIHILPAGHLESSGVSTTFGMLDVEGTVHLPAGALLGCRDVVMTIMPGGEVTIDDGATLGQAGLLVQPIENHGEIRKPPTGGTAVIENAFIQFLNNRADGLISVEGGTLECRNKLDSAGAIDIAAGATFRHRTWANYHAGTVITGDGWFHLDQTPNNFIDAGVDLDIPRFRLSGQINAGHSINGPGTITITKEFDAQGGLINVPQVMIQAGAVMNVSGPEFTGDDGVVFENFGTTNIIAQSLGFGVFNNRPGGIVDLQADFAFLNWFSNGPVNNEGLLTKSGGAGVSDLVASVTNTGTFRAASGTIVFTNSHNTFTQNAGLTELAGGSIRVASMTLNGGVLRGAGSLTANVSNNGATVEPGASPGILNVAASLSPLIAGNYTQGAGGMLAIEVGGLMPGTKHDRLVVDGTATLGGQLTVELIGGFVPADGDTITIIEAASVAGTFADVVPVGLPAGVFAAVDYNFTTARIIFTNVNPPDDGMMDGASDGADDGTGPTPAGQEGAMGCGACAPGLGPVLPFMAAAFCIVRRGISTRRP